MVAAALLASLAPAMAFAQEAAAAPRPPRPSWRPPTTTAQDPAPPSNVVTQTEPPAAAEDASSKPLSTAVWGRIGNYIQGADPTKLDDVSQDAEVDVLLSGQIHKYVGWQADFVGYFGGDQTGTAEILDLIGKLELHKAFNLWVGRMLVPSDRSNFSGPWFMAPWNYPGFYPGLGAPAGPRQGAFGRNDGATVWGDFGGGVFKYYLGAFDLRQRSESPLYTARINLSLLNPEPGYYHSSTYYGMDILAIGVGAQYKKDGSVAPPPMAGRHGDRARRLHRLQRRRAVREEARQRRRARPRGRLLRVQRGQRGARQPLLRPGQLPDPGQPGLRPDPAAGPLPGRFAQGRRRRLASLDVQVGYVISQYAARLAVGLSDRQGGRRREQLRVPGAAAPEVAAAHRAGPGRPAHLSRLCRGGRSALPMVRASVRRASASAVRGRKIEARWCGRGPGRRNDGSARAGSRASTRTAIAGSRVTPAPEATICTRVGRLVARNSVSWARPALQTSSACSRRQCPSSSSST